MNKDLIYKLLFYILGLFTMAFAVVLIIRSDLGNGGWDAFNVNLNLLSKGKITIGTSSMLIGLTFLIIILIYRKDKKYLFSLFPIFVTGFFVDLWDLYILKNFVLTEFYSRFIFFILGVFILPLGLSIMIQTNLSSMVYDEFTFILMDVTKIKSFAITRFIFEVFSIICAIIVGLLHNGKLNGVSYGTFVVSFLLGPIIGMWNLLFKKLNLTYKDKAPS